MATQTAAQKKAAETKAAQDAAAKAAAEKKAAEKAAADAAKKAAAEAADRKRAEEAAAAAEKKAAQEKAAAEKKAADQAKKDAEAKAKKDAADAAAKKKADDKAAADKAKADEAAARKAAELPPVPSPDIAKSADQMAALGTQWLDFAKNNFQVSQQQQAELQQLTTQLRDMGISVAQDQLSYTKQAGADAIAAADRAAGGIRTAGATGLAAATDANTRLGQLSATGLGNADAAAGRLDELGRAGIIEASSQQAMLAELSRAGITDATQQAQVLKSLADRGITTADQVRASLETLGNQQVALANQNLETARQVSADQLATADRLQTAADADRARFDTTFAPVEDRYVAEAEEYASGARQDQAAAAARADVAASAAAQREANQRQMASMGVAPGSGRFAGVERRADLDTALGQVGAATAARNEVRDKGFELREKAIGLGRGLVGQSQQGSALALSTQNSGMDTLESATGLGVDARNAAGGLKATGGQMERDALGMAADAATTGAQLKAGARAAASGNTTAAAQIGQNARGMAADATTTGTQLKAGALDAASGNTATGANLVRGATDSIASGEATGAGLKLDAINGSIANRGNAASGLIQTGTTATGLAQTNKQIADASSGMVADGFGGAMEGIGGKTSVLSDLYGQQLTGWTAKQAADAQDQAGLWGAIGTVGGALLGGATKPWILSSEELKEDKEPIADGEALEAVREMPVEEWTYKEGVADESRHVGPYAEDFQEATGKGDGHGIPLQDAVGITMRAVQDLDARITDIAAMIEATGLGRPAKKPVAANAEPTGLGMKRAA